MLQLSLYLPVLLPLFLLCWLCILLARCDSICNCPWCLFLTLCQEHVMPAPLDTTGQAGGLDFGLVDQVVRSLRFEHQYETQSVVHYATQDEYDRQHGRRAGDP